MAIVHLIRTEVSIQTQEVGLIKPFQRVHNVEILYNREKMPKKGKKERDVRSERPRAQEDRSRKTLVSVWLQ